MDQSKREHFAYLEALERKSKQGQPRTLAEQTHLQFLLGVHNERVATFGRVVQSLRTTDADAYERFLQYLTRLNEDLGEEG